MAGAVCHVCNEIHVFTFLAFEQTVNRVDDNLDDVDVLPFVETADIIRLGNLAIVEDDIDGTCMVFYIQPVAHVFTLAVYRKRFAVAYIVDEQRYQFLRELVWSVVVGAVGYDGRHSVSVVEGTYEMV